MRFNLALAALMLFGSGIAQAANVAALALTAAAGQQPTQESAKVVGHLYMQSNTIANEIVHFARHADGTLAEVERVATGGAGSGVFKPVSGQASAPNAFEGAGSVILAAGNRLLFATNGGDNSVSSFRVAPDGRLTLLDRQSTGEAVTGKSGATKSLAYSLGKDGSLAEVSRHPIANNSPQGLAGFRSPSTMAAQAGDFLQRVAA